MNKVINTIYSELNYSYIEDITSSDFIVRASVNEPTAWKVFKGGGWEGTTIGPDWIDIELDEPIRIWKFSIEPLFSLIEEEIENYSPGSFSIFGSNNGTYYDLIEKFEDINNYLYGYEKTFVLNAPTETAYKFYKIIIYKNVAGGVDHKTIGYLKFFKYLSLDPTESVIRMSKFLPEQAVNLAYASAPEISQENVGITNEYTIASKNNSWVGTFFTKSEIYEEKISSTPAVYQLKNRHIAENTEEVYAYSAPSKIFLMKDSDYTIDYLNGEIEILHFDLSGFFPTITIKYQYNPLDVLADNSILLPTEDILITKEYAVKSTEVEDYKPLFYTFILTEEILKPSKLVQFPDGKPQKILSLYINEADDLSYENAMPVSPIFYFLDENNNQIEVVNKTKLIKAGSNYIVQVFCNIDPNKIIYCCYNNSNNVFIKELITVTPVFNRIDYIDLDTENYDLTKDVYAVEEEYGIIKLFLKNTTKRIDDSIRIPTEIKLRVIGDLEVNYDNNNPATINLGVLCLDAADLSISSVFNIIKEQLSSYFPNYYNIINPHQISLPGLSSGPWAFNPSMPEDYLHDYDIIIITGYGSVDLSSYNELFKRYLERGGTIIIDCPEDEDSLLFNVDFGSINPISSYILSSITRTGTKTLEISEGYSDIWYNFTDVSNVGRIKELTHDYYVEDETSFSLENKSNFMGLEVYSYNYSTNLDESDYTIDLANGLLSITNIEYHATNIRVRGTYFSSPTLTISSSGFNTVINSTVSSTNTSPLLSVKNFNNSGRLYISCLGFISGISNTIGNNDINKKFLTNLFLYIMKRKTLKTPWVSFKIYHSSELFELEKQTYKYEESLYNSNPVTVRTVSDSVGKFLEKYTNIRNATGEYRFDVLEKINGSFIEAVNAIVNYGKDFSYYEDPIEIFSISPKSTLEILPDSEKEYIVGFSNITGSVSITPFVFYYDVGDSPFISVEDSLVKGSFSFEINEKAGETELTRIISILPPLPGGTRWANTDYLYYKINLNSYENQQDGRISLFIKDKYNGNYLYSSDGGLILSHSFLYDIREGNRHVYEDIYLYASAESHEIYTDGQTFSITTQESQSSKISLPKNLNENECWFVDINNISLSEIDPETGYVYYYETVEYFNQPWLYGFPFNFTENETAKYIDRNTISLQKTPIYYIRDTEIYETPELIEPGVYKSSKGNWNTNRDFYLGRPYVLYKDGDPIPYDLYSVDFYSGLIVFNDGEEPTVEEITIRYAYDNLNIRRKLYKSNRITRESLAVLNKKYRKIISAENKEILSNPLIKIERSLQDGGGIINPVLYSVDYKTGIISFKEEVPENLIITYTYNQIEKIYPIVVNKNGFIKMAEDLHFNDTVIVDYYNYSYSYEYKGYLDGSHFVGIDLNPTFGHESTITTGEYINNVFVKSYENIPSYNLINQELFIYLLPKKIFDRATNSYISKGYMEGITNNITLRHTWNASEFNRLIEQFPEIKLLGVIKITNNKSLYDVIIMDTRSRGGGLVKEISNQDIKNISPRSLDFWDISKYAGVSYNTNGVVIIRLPDSILESFSVQEVDEICQKHLAAGVKKIVKFYKGNREKIFINLLDADPYDCDSIMPEGLYPEYIELTEALEYIADEVTGIETDIDIFIPEEDE